MSRVLPALLDLRVDPADAARLVERRSVTARISALLGTPGARVTGSVYWPIALVHARAESTGRRQWTEHTLGAVDLISGRIGLLDEEPRLEREVAVAPEGIVAPRLGKTTALTSWHDYHRDYIDRRRRPMRPPALSVERVEPVWLEHRVVFQGNRRFLVDPVTHRPDPLAHFPWVEQHLTPPDPDSTHPTKEHTCTA